MIDRKAESIVTQCPSCRAAVQAKLVSVVEPGDEELDDLLVGRLNLAACGECGNDFLVDIPLIYCDREDQYLLCCISADEWADQCDIVAAARHRLSSIFEQWADQSLQQVCRIVFQRRNFIEKIMIHDHGLDDRIIEYLKYHLFTRPGAETDPVRVEMLYDFTGRDDSVIPFILFERETGAAVAATHVPIQTYSELSDELLSSGAFSAELERLFPGPLVSVDNLFLSAGRVAGSQCCDQ